MPPPPKTQCILSVYTDLGRKLYNIRPQQGTAATPVLCLSRLTAVNWPRQPISLDLPRMKIVSFWFEGQWHSSQPNSKIIVREMFFRLTVCLGYAAIS